MEQKISKLLISDMLLLSPWYGTSHYLSAFYNSEGGPKAMVQTRLGGMFVSVFITF
jgi:hypothetical protein